MRKPRSAWKGDQLTHWRWGDAVVFLTGVGTGGVFFAFAREAAVGASNPEGVLGRLGVTVGVLDLMGVEVALLARERARIVEVFDAFD